MIVEKVPEDPPANAAKERRDKKKKGAGKILDFTGSLNAKAFINWTTTLEGFQAFTWYKIDKFQYAILKTVKLKERSHIWWHGMQATIC